MVSTTTVWMIFLSLILTIPVPLILITTLLLLKKIRFLPVMTGALVFGIFQLTLRIPIINKMVTLTEFQWLFENAIISGLFLGITAGLFEEFGRFIGCKTIMRNRLEWKDGLAMGLGAGTLEAIMLVGLTSINNLFYAHYINIGAFESLVSSLPTQAAQQLFDVMTQTPSYTFLMGGIERIFAITIQVALSILVVYSVRRKELKYLWLAVAAHFIINSPLSLLGPAGVWITEFYIMLCAAAALIYIIKSRKHFRELS